MPLAQIELMCADCPVTVYPKTDTVKGRGGKEYKFHRPSSASLREAREDFASWVGGPLNAEIDISGFSF